MSDTTDGVRLVAIRPACPPALRDDIHSFVDCVDCREIVAERKAERFGTQMSRKDQSVSFHVTITADADRQFQWLSVREQRILAAAISSRLQHQPQIPTKAIKRLRPNPLAEFELRAGDLRALYNVEEQEVVIVAVGRKRGNSLIVEGEEFHVHQDHLAEPPGNRSPADPE
jgi:mRNA-degrading endonuclease RelE of RelBE toxin-antitoxin system